MDTYLDKIQKLCLERAKEVQKDLPKDQPNSDIDSMAGVEAFLSRLETTDANQQPSYPLYKSSDLKDLINSFDEEELEEFLRDWLTEKPGLMNLPLFPSSKVVSKEEIAFDWLLNLPHKTTILFTNVFERLLERALIDKEINDESITLINKIFAFVAKNRNGLSFQYLKNKLAEDNLQQKASKPKDELLSPQIKLQLATLLVNHEEYSLDFEEIEQLLRLEIQRYILPVLIEAYLKDEKDGVYRALLLLNRFSEWDLPVKQIDIRPDMDHIFTEIARGFRKLHPFDWKEQLKIFVSKKLKIKNAWLRERMLDVLPFLKVPYPSESISSIKEEVNSKYYPTSFEKPLIPPIKLSLTNEIKTEEIQELVQMASRNEQYMEAVVDLIVNALKENAEQGAAHFAKPIFVMLKQQEVNVETVFLTRGVAVSVFPYYYVNAAFMHAYREPMEMDLGKKDSDIPIMLKDIQQKREKFGQARVSLIKNKVIEVAAKS